MRSVPLLRGLSADTKLRVKAATPTWLLRRFRPNAIRVARNDPAADRHGGGIPLFALVCTWNEADIIHASVSNAFALGADEVFLLDNGSTDETVAEAQLAGVRHVLWFDTDSFDELFKYRLINEVIRQRSQASRHERIWWMLMDADEFNATPEGESLPEFLASVDKRCRVVGARVFDHYPTPGVPYVRRTNPLGVQPLCREKVDHRCDLGHHKHPIFLWERHRPEIVVEPGFHQLSCRGEALYEPERSLFMHHHPFRSEADSRRRLDLLAQRGFAGGQDHLHDHVRSRMRVIEAVYAARFDEVPDHLTGVDGVSLRRFDEWLTDSPERPPRSDAG